MGREREREARQAWVGGSQGKGETKGLWGGMTALCSACANVL